MADKAPKKDNLTWSMFEQSLQKDDSDAFSCILPDTLSSLPKGSMLRRCVQEKAEKCVTALLTKYPDYPINEFEPKSRATALHLAAAFCPQEISNYIFSVTGSGEDFEDIGGRSYNKFKGLIYGRIIETLLDHGADPTKRDKQKDSARCVFQRMRLLSGESNFLMPIFSSHVRIKEDLDRVQAIMVTAQRTKQKKGRTQRTCT